MKISELKEGQVIDLTPETTLKITAISDTWIDAEFTMKSFNTTMPVDRMTYAYFIDKLSEYGIEVTE